jgi:hypothetical protein
MAEDALGLQEKLADYSLNVEHEDGGPKARGFKLILGITLEDLDYLENSIRIGILTAPVEAVRDNAPHGLNCVVTVAVQGLGVKSSRIVDVRTVWEITGHGAPPRLVNAFPRP